VWLVAILLGSWVCPSFAQDALTKLLVAHAGLISTHASVWLAEDQGFYKKHGLDATSVFTGSGSVTSQALVAGEATPQSVQVMYDTTLEIHAKTKVRNVPLAGVQNMIDALLRINPRMAKLKAADIVDSSFIERLEKSGYIKEATKRSG
jgi:ABC-type nitrate/sulfonate/bicarbonate transport system substrate-binding protein